MRADCRLQVRGGVAVLAAAGALLFLFDAGRGSAAGAMRPRPAGTILYEVVTCTPEPGGHGEVCESSLWTLVIRTRAQRHLTPGLGGSDAAWSPDGRRIAFVADLALWSMNADGSRQRRLARSAASPSWSPDGRRVAFSAGPELDAITVVDVDGGGRRLIARAPAAVFALAWSPDGTSLAYAVQGPTLGAERLFVVRLDGRRPRFLAVGDAPRWSPDGSEIAFEARPKVKVIRADGTRLRTVSRSTGKDRTFAWSPDGKRLAFVRDFGLVSARTDGSGLRRVAVEGDDPAWSPNGRWIAFVWDNVIYVVGPDGMGRRAVLPVPQGGLAGRPLWRPGT